MTKLFHGSNIPIDTPLVSMGRDKVDFGKGFYLTKLQNQAQAWAKIIASRKSKNAVAVVSSYEFDDEFFKGDKYRIKMFDSYNLEWLDYVIDCRRGGEKQHFYDFVEGGIANDNVIDTVEDYENGIITAEQALGQLKYKEINHQICILNQEIIDKYLTFISSESI